MKIPFNPVKLMYKIKRMENVIFRRKKKVWKIAMLSYIFPNFEMAPSFMNV